MFLLPVLAIFDLDGTLFPFLAGREVHLPFTRNDKGDIVNGKGDIINYFPEAPYAIEKLLVMDIEILLTTDDKKIFEGTNQLINLFGWDKYNITLKELYLDDDNKHILYIHNKFKIPFHKMIYYTNWRINAILANRSEVFSAYVDPWVGITMRVLDGALDKYELYHEKIRKGEKVKRPIYNSLLK